MSGWLSGRSGLARCAVGQLVLVVLVAAAGGHLARAGVIGHRSVQLAPANRVVLGSSFQRVSGVTGDVEASGDYLAFPTQVTGINHTPPFQPVGWIVTNQPTGATTALDPRCGLGDLGPPWVLLSCPQPSGLPGSSDVELYSLTDGTQQVVTPSSGVPPQCSEPQAASSAASGEAACAGPAAVGAYWIEWTASCYHCAVTDFFQNIQTGELRSDPTNATTYADLNSPALAHRTCPGVRLMGNGSPPYDDEGPWNSLTPDGQFALVTDGNGNSFLERCGTRMRRQLTGLNSESYDVEANSGAVIWQEVPSQLNGLFLPSLQPFTIPLPSAIVRPPGATENSGAGFTLTSDTLYVIDGWYGRIWRTASPTALPVNTSRPSLTRSGTTLSCKRGSWLDAERFSYAWHLNGVRPKDASHTMAISKTRGLHRVSCTVTASNANGTTTATSAPLR